MIVERGKTANQQKTDIYWVIDLGHLWLCPKRTKDSHKIDADPYLHVT